MPANNAVGGRSPRRPDFVYAKNITRSHGATGLTEKKKVIPNKRNAIRIFYRHSGHAMREPESRLFVFTVELQTELSAMTKLVLPALFLSLPWMPDPVRTGQARR